MAEALFPVDVTSVLVTSAIGLVIYAVYSWHFPKDIWSQYGVKQVKVKAGQMLDYRSVFKALGPSGGDTVGFKQGYPTLLTRDLDLLKEVLIKDFPNFTDRPGGLKSNSPVSESLIFSKQDRWKRLRRIMSPAFASGKLKHIAKTVDDSAQVLATYFEQCAQNDILVAVKDTGSQYTSQIIAKSAFGFHPDCIGKEDDEFTYYSKNITKGSGPIRTVFRLLGLVFPRLLHILITKLQLTFLDPFNQEPTVYFKSVLDKSVAQRDNFKKGDKHAPVDLLQQLVEAKRLSSDKNGSPDNNTTEKHSTDHSMSYNELIGSSILIILAGFDTTSTTLQMALYMLAKNPDIQEKVFNEIDSIIPSGSPSYDQLGELVYLEQFINETLRVYPIANNVRRTTMATKTYGDITIPKGSVVVVPLIAILSDPRHFPNPDEFDPDHFSPENCAKRHPLAFMPFGQGPRMCIGMRLAYMELKLALVHVVRKVRIELNDVTEPKIGGDIEIASTILLQPKKPIQLACKLR